MIRWLLILVILALPARAATDVEVLTTDGGIEAWLVRDAVDPHRHGQPAYPRRRGAGPDRQGRGRPTSWSP